MVLGGVLLMGAMVFGEGAASQPGVPAWMARAPETWPQILLANEYRERLPNGTYGAGFFGAGAFLMRLPDGRVAGVTARHVFDDHPKLAEFDKTPHVWALAGPTNPKVRVVMGKLIEDPAEVGDLDVVIAAAATQGGPFPAAAIVAGGGRRERWKWERRCMWCGCRMRIGGRRCRDRRIYRGEECWTGWQDGRSSEIVDRTFGTGGGGGGVLGGGGGGGVGGGGG